MCEQDEVAEALHRLASAIMPPDVAPGRDEYGGVIGSLTEAVMSVANGLHDIAQAIHRIAEIQEMQADRLSHEDHAEPIQTHHPDVRNRRPLP